MQTADRIFRVVRTLYWLGLVAYWGVMFGMWIGG